MEGILISYPTSVLELSGPNSKVDGKLQLCNLTAESRLTFKVKSNAPRGALVVRPSLGVLSPKEVLDVSITVHRLGTELKKNFKLKILYVILSDNEVDLDWIWKNYSSDRIYDRKMDVHYRFIPGFPESRALVGLKNTHLGRLNDVNRGTGGSGGVREAPSQRIDLEELLADLASIVSNQVYGSIILLIIGFIMGKWIF